MELALEVITPPPKLSYIRVSILVIMELALEGPAMLIAKLSS